MTCDTPAGSLRRHAGPSVVAAVDGLGAGPDPQFELDLATHLQVRKLLLGSPLYPLNKCVLICPPVSARWPRIRVPG